MTVRGEEAPVAVRPPGLAVTTYDVAAYGPSGVNDTVAAPSLNGRLVPTSVALTLIGLNGIRKSFEPWLILPTCFDMVILL